MIIEASNSSIPKNSDLTSSNDLQMEATASTYRALTMKQLVDSDLLLRFVSVEKSEYYRKKFRDIVEASDIENVRLNDVSWRSLTKGLTWTSIGFARMLPFTKRTFFNWPAGLFDVFWGVWRGTAYKWQSFAAFIAAMVIDDIVAHFTGYSFWAYVSFALLVPYAIWGNTAFLLGIIRELRSGDIRKHPTSVSDLVLSVVLFLAVGIGTVVAFPTP